LSRTRLEDSHKRQITDDANIKYSQAIANKRYILKYLADTVFQ